MKNIKYKILFFILVILLMAVTILCVYTIRGFIKQVEFKFDKFIMALGSLALGIALLIGVTGVTIKMIGGNDNGKNSEVRKDK